MKPTMRDVAQKANVSLATVSRALSGTGYIKEDTLELVINACRELGYSNIGDRESKEQSNLIGVVTADLANEFNIILIEGITNVLRRRGYDVIIYDQQENPARSLQAIDTFKKLPLNGIILTPVMDTTTLGFQYIGELEKVKIPIVLVDRDIKYSHFNGVFLDNVYGAVSAVTALIREGHTKIATITGTNTSLTGRDRLTGYKKAMLIEGLEVRDDYIRSGEFTVSGGYEAAAAFFGMEDPPTAIFVANSVMMKGVVKAIRDQKLRVPEDVAIISFDDLVNSQSLPNLSVVAQPMKSMGEKAAEILLDHVCTPMHCKEDIMRLVLPPSIVLRGSEKYIQPSK